MAPYLWSSPQNSPLIPRRPKALSESSTLDEVSLGCLRTTRAKAGRCSVAGLLSGSETANYENIDYSGAEVRGRGRWVSIFRGRTS